MLWVLARVRDGRAPLGGSAASGIALSGCAIFFLLTCVSLSAATGALLLLGAVQATMIGAGLARGERMRPARTAGLACALAGLVALLLPGLAAPPLAAASMLAAGASRGVHSLRGRGQGDPTAETAGKVVRAVPAALAAALLLDGASWLGAPAPHDWTGVGLAVASGAVTWGLGYAIWHGALRKPSATVAATVQPSVPVITAAGGVLLLAEPLTPRLVRASAAVPGGIAAVVLARGRSPA